MKKTVNRKNKKSKKHSRKYLPWIATLGILAIGVSVATPLAIIYSGNDDKPGPDPTVDDPGILSAYPMVAWTDFDVSSSYGPFIINTKVPTDKTQIKFTGGIRSGAQSPLGFWSTEPNTTFKNVKYLEFDSQWMNVVGEDYTEWDTNYGSGFFYDNANCLYKNLNIDLLIFRDCRPKNLYDVATYSTNFSKSGDGALDGNNAYFFDFPVNTMSTENYKGENKKPFTVNPKTIYVRDGNGTKEQWMAKLNVTDKSIFKIVKKN